MHDAASSADITRGERAAVAENVVNPTGEL